MSLRVREVLFAEDTGRKEFDGTPNAATGTVALPESIRNGR